MYRALATIQNVVVGSCSGRPRVHVGPTRGRRPENVLISKLLTPTLRKTLLLHSLVKCLNHASILIPYFQTFQTALNLYLVSRITAFSITMQLKFPLILQGLKKLVCSRRQIIFFLNIYRLSRSGHRTIYSSLQIVLHHRTTPSHTAKQW